MSINKVILVGNVGSEPEIRATQDGREIANFSLATSESWTDKRSGEKQEKTEWHRVVVFASVLASVVKNYVKKGSKLYIEGSLQTRKWTDKQGVEKYTTEVVLQNFNSTLQILNKIENNEISQHSKDKGNGYAPESSHVDENDDEIAF